MFTTNMNGHTIGGTETITPTKDSSGLHFTVTSLSPFAIGWTKPAAPVEPEKPVDPNPGGGGGGGGGGIVASGFDIIVDTDPNGTVTLSRKNAAEGDTVTLTAVPKEGYALSSLTVTDAKGGAVKLTEQDDGTYRFTMPASKVTVKAAFAKEGKPSDQPFTDVKEGDFFFDAVRWAVENGVTAGTSAVTFSPDRSCTRGQIVTFLWRAAGSPEPQGSTIPFADVAAGSYYEKAVLWAVEQGITSGTSAAAFSPDAACTRGQSVTFLYRAAGSP